jgi:hypothetical protein
VSEHEPEAYVFELGTNTQVVSGPRQFDARTGKPLAARPSHVGSLRVSLPDRQIAVTVERRELDDVFDGWLAGMVEALATNTTPGSLDAQAAAQLGRARALYARVMTRFAPRVISLHGFRHDAENLTVELALEGATAREVPDPIALLTLSVQRTGGEFALVSLLDEASTLKALRCADELEALADEVERGFSAPHEQGECNALGVLLPGPCERGAPELLARALDVRARCSLPKNLTFPSTRTKKLEDFQLTLKRGKVLGGLDREPRYVLAIHPGGQVVFFGRHWVSSTERRDGRTSESVLAALSERFREVDFFDRKGGEWDPEHCSPEEDLGNVLTLHARGRERMVVDRDGCRGPFSARELASLIQAIEAAAGLSAWTTPRPEYADPGQQVWTISAE